MSRLVGARQGSRNAIVLLATGLLLSSFSVLPGAPVAQGLILPAAYEETGTLDGAPYRLVVPAQWGGTLLVYAHGYRDKADDPDETDDRSVLVAPSLGTLEDNGMEDLLLAQGYALAGTAYGDNGLVLDRGQRDVEALVAHLQGVLAGRATVPGSQALDRTVLMGCSMASWFTMRLAETDQGAIDGFIALGAIGAGATRTLEWMVAAQLAFDVLFGWPESWGEPGNVRNAGDDPAHPQDLDFDGEVVAAFAPIFANPANQGRLEFLRLLLDIPLEGWHASNDNPFWFLLLFLATEGAAEWENRFGEPPVGNRDHTYSLDEEEKEHVRSLDPTLDPDALLDAMNERTTIKAEKEAKKALASQGDLDGGLDAPLITFKSTMDGITPPFHDGMYRDQVEQAKRTENLVQLFTNDKPTHCTFTPGQIVSAVAAMESWIDTGARPSPDAFPEALGFDAEFQPGPWPFEGSAKKGGGGHGAGHGRDESTHSMG